MTPLQDPLQAKVFMVGKNQAKTYAQAAVGSHDRFLDTLFNRKGRSRRGLYDTVTGGKSSPTRSNIDALTQRLERRGVRAILETNVICYSTPTSSNLSDAQHRGGKERGTEIFRALLAYVKPPILTAHGAGTRTELGRVLGTTLPVCPKGPEKTVDTVASYQANRFRFFVIPSLAPPAYNRWHGWAPAYLDRVADEAAGLLARS